VKTLAGRSAKGVLNFVEIINKYRQEMATSPVTAVLAGVLADSGYVQELHLQGTDEAADRLQNVQELMNAATQFQEETEEATLENFLTTKALSSDLDNLDDKKAVSLMTLHSSKGLEFPIVFLVGLEEGLFPNYRSLNDPAALEEERRLCYVGITRAQELLYISYARARRLYGQREPAVSSQFLTELPRELLQSNQIGKMRPRVIPPTAAEKKQAAEAPPQVWTVGEKVLHGTFGVGEITHVFGSDRKVSVAVKFVGVGPKVLEPRATGLRKISKV
jgi:DNA helicase-2/ATP-dependent DNA helicase PcrA